MTASTNEEGEATFLVHTGKYSASVEITGFKSAKVEDIKVTPDQTNKVEVTLDAGSNTENVAVTDSHSTAQKERTLTIEVKDEKDNPLPNVNVRVRRLGCMCGACPSGVACLSDCCDCQGGDCICCIDSSEVTNTKGRSSVNAPPGEYEVSFSIDGESYGTLSGITVSPEEKGVKISTQIERVP